MKVLKNWLENWVDLTGINDTELLSILEKLGYEIEGYSKISPKYKNIIVGTAAIELVKGGLIWIALFIGGIILLTGILGLRED